MQAPTPERFDVTRDAFLLADGPRVVASGPWSDRPAAADREEDASAFVATPAFVDPHVHLPQFDLRDTAGQHGDLLQWLADVVFPAEERIASDAAEARALSQRFYRALLFHGTAAAGVFAPHSEEAARACFERGAKTPLRLSMGPTLMDRNVPPGLRAPSAEAAVARVERLASEFHGALDGRLKVAVAPRFAPACSPSLLRYAGELARAKALPVFTHLSENEREVAWVRRLEPDARDYLHAYERAGLAGSGTVFGHCVHLSGDEARRVRQSGGWIAHCPTSNAALASGRFPLEAHAADERVALASDVGASPSLSLVDAMAAARAAHPAEAATPARLLHMATVAGARALGWGRELGWLGAGADASFLLWPKPESVFQASKWLDALLARARAEGRERVRPARVVVRGEPA